MLFKYKQRNRLRTFISLNCTERINFFYNTEPLFFSLGKIKMKYVKNKVFFINKCFFNNLKKLFYKKTKN